MNMGFDLLAVVFINTFRFDNTLENRAGLRFLISHMPLKIKYIEYIPFKKNLINVVFQRESYKIRSRLKKNVISN